MAQILAKLNNEDLARWRMVMANKELVDGSYPGMSVIEARETVLNFYKTLNDLLQQYGIDHDPGDALVLSPISGEFLRFEQGM